MPSPRTLTLVLAALSAVCVALGVLTPPPVSAMDMFSFSGTVQGDDAQGNKIILVPAAIPGGPSREAVIQADNTFRVDGVLRGFHDIVVSNGITGGPRAIDVQQDTVIDTFRFDDPFGGGGGGVPFPGAVDRLTVKKLRTKVRPNKPGKDSVKLTGRIETASRLPIDPAVDLVIDIGPNFSLMIPAGSFVPRGRSGRTHKHTTDTLKATIKLRGKPTKADKLVLFLRNQTLVDRIDPGGDRLVRVRTGAFDETDQP